MQRTNAKSVEPRLGVDLVEGVKDELHETALAAALGCLLAEGARVGVVVYVAPEAPRKLLGIHGHAVDLAVELGEGAQREGPARLRAAEAHVAPRWTHLLDDRPRPSGVSNHACLV